MKKSIWLLGINFFLLGSFYSFNAVEACSNTGYCGRNNSNLTRHYQNNSDRNYSQYGDDFYFKNKKSITPQLYPTYSYMNGTQTMDLEVVPVDGYNYRTQHYYRSHYNNRNYSNNVSIPIYAKNYEYNPNAHNRVYRYVSNGVPYLVSPASLNYRYSNY